MAPANISSLVERWRNIHIDVPSNKPPEPPPGLVGKVDRKHETLSPLSCMPPELDASSTIWFALLVADQITDARDLICLASTSKAHYQALISRAYRSIHFYFSDLAVKARRHRLALCLGTALSPGVYSPSVEVMARCWLDDRLVGRDQYVTCQEKKLCNQTSLFRFSGSYPFTAWGQLWDMDIPPPDPWKLHFGQLSDLVNLQEYRADVDWRLADMNQVVQLSCSLKSLTVPVRYPDDCGILAKELKRLHRLESLTILSLPILDEFVDVFPLLAEGLTARASSLRSLAIELTAHSRPYSWDTDDFVIPEPDEMDKYFRALFPKPVKNITSTCGVHPYCWNRAGLQEMETVFQLTYLGLQHFGVPWDAFRDTFSKEHIKDLCLPNTEVDAEVWTDLKGTVDLRSLTHIDYDILTPQLVDFLGSQENLETLSFSKPLPDREFLGVASLGPATSPWYQTGIIEAGEPEHEDLLQLTMVALRNLPKLKSLSIPADMYDISCLHLQNLGSAFPKLERIELALNYSDLVLLETFRDFFIPLHPCLRKVTFLSCRGKDPLALLGHGVKLSRPRPFCQGIKYLRYFLLNGERQTYYEIQTDSKDSNLPQHLRLDGEEGDEIFEEERTPTIFPPPRPRWEIEECNKKRL